MLAFSIMNQDVTQYYVNIVGVFAFCCPEHELYTLNSSVTLFDYNAHTLSVSE